jgi:hypothetical protein
MKDIDLHEALEEFKNPTEVKNDQIESRQTNFSETETSKLADVYYRENKMYAWRDSCVKTAQLAENGFKKFSDACSTLEQMIS